MPLARGPPTHRMRRSTSEKVGRAVGSPCQHSCRPAWVSPVPTRTRPERRQPRRQEGFARRRTKSLENLKSRLVHGRALRTGGTMEGAGCSMSSTIGDGDT